ncbi:MAG: GH36 C-terminal domain-containing protein [Thermoguttaceae bacterium]
MRTTLYAIVAALTLIGLPVTAQAAEPRSGDMNQTWTLTTDDTELTLAVTEHAISIVSLRNPMQKWNWTPSPSRVPMPGVQTGKAGQAWTWEYRDAVEDKKSGHQVILRFTCADPAMELKSVWQALPGPGPVENEVFIENKSGDKVVFPPTLAAAKIDLAVDGAVTLHRARKTSVGVGEVLQNVIDANASVATDSSIIPFLLLGVCEKHGAYLGYEWELGGFRVSSAAKPQEFTVSAFPVTENVTRAPGAVFTVPSVYYGTYPGDLDDGANRFKRWFWNHKITRSLHDNKNEPWSEVCMQDVSSPSGNASVVGTTPQSVYDRLAATGVECVKMDFWDGSGKCWYTDRDWMFHPANWPNGFDFAAKAHKAGLKASLYMGGTYNDADLTTIAGQDAELEAVLTRYDKGWFDMWRTDLYTAPREPMPQTYEGVANFLYIQDRLIGSRPGYRYENCCNGGKYKGFAICRRMTFCTMNDDDRTPWKTRSTYYSNTYAINPVQLKSDVGSGPNVTSNLRTAIMGPILTWAFDTAEYRRHIALYKAKQRPILRGANVYHILPMADGVHWDGLQFHNPDIKRGSVFLFKPSADVPPSRVIRLKGLSPRAVYRLTFQDRKDLNCVRTGVQLMTDGIYVTGMTGANASEIVWIEETPES